MIPTTCLFFTGVGRVEFGETELPEPGPDDVLIKTSLSGISPGTELRCLAGEQDGLGRDRFPFIPGYSLVGTVVRASGCHAGLHGRVVFSSGARRAKHAAAWGGHIADAVVPGDSVMPIPDGISMEDAVMAKLAAIAHRGVQLANPQPGEDVVVVGLGMIGQMSVRLFAQTGARVLGVDLSAERCAVARRVGIPAIVPTNGLEAGVRSLLPQGAPIVVDATGVRGLLGQTMNLLRDKPWDESDTAGGRLVVQGSYTAEISMPSTTAFAKEMTMLWPRDSQRRDLEFVLASLQKGTLSFAGLLSGVFAPSEAQAIYDRLRGTPGEFMTAAFHW
jgi:2-desacetyl-2-hydroxyethyl bacteriochlorophyllide A dehydrogenase